MPVTISHVQVENHREALGIGEARPRISWRFVGDEHDWVQTCSEIEIQLDDFTNGPQKPCVYRRQSQQSQWCEWPGECLRSRESATIRVRACGGKDQEYTPWSEKLKVEAGILSRNEWTRKSSVIESSDEHAEGVKQPILFRRVFSLEGPITRARLYITAFGIYEATVNGTRVGNHVLAPGWQDYHSRLEYQTFDVTPNLAEGSNVLAVAVGEGWYSGRLGFNGGRPNIWGTKIGLLANLVITFVDGQSKWIGTDSSWKWSTGSILSSSIYDGEAVDFRLEQPEWVSSAYNDKHWKNAMMRDLAANVLLSSPDGPPVRRTQELRPVSIFKSPSQKTVIDFGQNIAGWIRIKLPAGRQEGHKVVITHTEVLEHGECATRPLRAAAATDTLIFANSTVQTIWEPKFTFHGFRYVQIDNWPLEFEHELKDITAIVIHTDMERTGWFECSDDLLNKLHQNIIWSMRGNFISVPTDCPQRDERLGWTGDIAIFANTANFLYDTNGMLKGWLKGLEAEQTPSGVPPLVSPNVLAGSPFGQPPQALWGDAVVTLPWDLYQAYGDTEFLRQKYRSMQKWVDKGIPRNTENRLWYPILQLGDWLDIEAPPNEPGNGNTDRNIVANAFLINTVDVLQKVSHLLGHEAEARRYTDEAIELRKAFAHEYITQSGRVVADTQTAIALAIHFSLFPRPSQQLVATARLQEIIKDRYRFKIATGFAGTPILGHALTKVNQSQLFYRMLLHKKNPSWLYPVTMGSTTVWERWDSMLPDGTINCGEMTSFNHYAYGAVADWMHRNIGGLKCAAPGWKEITINPIPGGTITSASCSHLTPYGLAKTSWRVVPATTEREAPLEFQLEVLIPPNSQGSVKLPGLDEPIAIGSGSYNFQVPYTQPSWPPIPIYPPFFPHVDDQP